MADEIVYVRWIPHPRDMPEAERMARVRDGVSHDYWSDLVVCSPDGVVLDASAPCTWLTGDIAMQQTKHQVDGKDVTVVRDARQGDPGFDAKLGPQKVIRQDDGTERTVAATAIKQVA